MKILRKRQKNLFAKTMPKICNETYYKQCRRPKIKDQRFGINTRQDSSGNVDQSSPMRVWKRQHKVPLRREGNKHQSRK